MIVITTVVVFNINKPGNIAKAIIGERVGTLIGAKENEPLRSEHAVVSD